MDAVAELGTNSVSKHQIQPEYGDGRLTRDGTAEPVSRDQIPRRERGQGNIHFPCSADHVQDWQLYPIDPSSCYMCDHTYIHTYSISRATTIDSDCYRLRTASVLSNEADKSRSNQF